MISRWQKCSFNESRFKQFRSTQWEKSHLRNALTLDFPLQTQQNIWRYSDSTFLKTFLSKRYKTAIFRICSMLLNYQHLHLKHLRTARGDSPSPHPWEHKSGFPLFLINRFCGSHHNALRLAMEVFVHRQQVYFPVKTVEEPLPYVPNAWGSLNFRGLALSLNFWITNLPLSSTSLEIITALW